MGKYKVSGICFVPAEAWIEVEANSQSHAKRIAADIFEKRPQKFFIEDGDDGAAFDLEIHAITPPTENKQ